MVNKLVRRMLRTPTAAGNVTQLMNPGSVILPSVTITCITDICYIITNSLTETHVRAWLRSLSPPPRSLDTVPQYHMHVRTSYVMFCACTGFIVI